MIAAKITSNLPELRAELERLKGDWSEVAQDSIGEVLEIGERVAKKAATVGVTSNFRNSITSEQGVKGAGERVTFHGELYSDLSYAAAADEGRRPGKMPPIDSLVRWVEVKLGASKKESRSIAFLVARKIGAKGTKRPHGNPPHAFDKAYEAMKRELPRIVLRHVDKARRRFEGA